MPLHNIRLVVILAFFFSMVSCIKEIRPPLRTVTPKLVVEGGITTDTTPYQVKLSFSGPYRFGQNIPDSLIIEDAQVSIADNIGRSTPLTYKGNGIYVTTDTTFIGQSGKAYQVHITLQDGRSYISQPEKIAAPVTDLHVSKVEFDADYDFQHPTDLKIFVDVNDPPGEENYYLWKAYSWVPRKATGVPCGNYCIKWIYCTQLINRPFVTTFSDASINGNTIREQFIYRSPIYWFGRHYLDISQQAITREHFQFWKRFEEQNAKTGSILDPLPAPIEGNIYNVANPDDLALGYFSASSVTHKKVMLVPFSISQFLLDQTALYFVKEGGCHLVYPDALEDKYNPTGWENAEEIEVHW
ncbi:MAG TPA: DUF4249 domain-containing protein [Flavitalea sp.]|nr:DUF4249 domain-containing protein [Flavitalea sp.]